MKSILLCCLLAVTYTAADEPAFYCGRQLAVAREIVCYGNKKVNNPKRASTQSILMDILNEDKENELDWPWKGRQGALSADWSRYKRDGLADECCLKPCTVEVLLSYCD